MPRPAGTCSDFELLEHGLHRDDVALELQLRLLQPGGDADQLREVQDRHLEVLPSRGLQLRLPRVQREVAERARSHERIGAGLLRLLDRLDELAERRFLTRLDDREAAAFDLRGVVDRLAAACLDDPLERPGAVGVLEAEDLRRAQDLAAVERRDLEALEPLVRRLLEQLVPLSFGDLPEQVPHLDVPAVRRDADALEVVADALPQAVVVLQLPIRLPQIQRADVADRQQRVAASRLGVGEDARVEVQVVVGLGFVDVAGAAAGHRLELDELEADLRRERLRRRVELLRRERGEATLVVRDASHPSACGGSTPGWISGAFSRTPASSVNSIRPSACSPCTIPSAPSRPCSLTRLYSARASPTFSATCGGNGGGTLPRFSNPSANFVCLIAETTPCVFGTSSVSRSQPVVNAERTNHLACFAPMSWSIPCLIDSAPSFAIASRGSTPFGQRSLQK